MGLSWQQGPLAPAAVGRFLVADALLDRMLFAEPLRRRMRVRFGDTWIVDSEDVVLLHEPGRYPVAYFPLGDVTADVLQPGEHTTRHRDLGTTAWYTVRAGTQSRQRAAWQHTELPNHAGDLKGRVAFAWRAMDAFYEEDERIVGHAADSYHRIDIRSTSRHLVVRTGDRVVADTIRPLVPTASPACSNSPTPATFPPAGAPIRRPRAHLLCSAQHRRRPRHVRPANTMTTPAPQPDRADEDKRTAAAPADLDPIAVTPAIGPMPAIYIPRSSNKACAAHGIWLTAARAACRVVQRATRRPPDHRTPQEGEPSASSAARHASGIDRRNDARDPN
ncbi:DUF427 domain-containing protein [Streptomyces mirabilis]